MRTFKTYSVGNFKIYNTVLSIRLHTTALGLFKLIPGNLYLLSPPSPISLHISVGFQMRRTRAEIFYIPVYINHWFRFSHTSLVCIQMVKMSSCRTESHKATECSASSWHSAHVKWNGMDEGLWVETCGIHLSHRTYSFPASRGASAALLALLE